MNSKPRVEGAGFYHLSRDSNRLTNFDTVADLKYANSELS
jgi:hypothetical protein